MGLVTLVALAKLAGLVLTVAVAGVRRAVKGAL